MDTENIDHGHAVAGPASDDDGRRYVLTGPRGVSEFLDKLRPDADHHTITVHGSADLARRLAEADALGVCASWRRLNEPTETANDETDGW